jgi:hypothetical protein
VAAGALRPCTYSRLGRLAAAQRDEVQCLQLNLVVERRERHARARHQLQPVERRVQPARADTMRLDGLEALEVDSGRACELDELGLQPARRLVGAPETSPGLRRRRAIHHRLAGRPAADRQAARELQTVPSGRDGEAGRLVGGSKRDRVGAGQPQRRLGAHQVLVADLPDEQRPPGQKGAVELERLDIRPAPRRTSSSRDKGRLPVEMLRELNLSQICIYLYRKHACSAGRASGLGPSFGLADRRRAAASRAIISAHAG